MKTLFISMLLILNSMTSFASELTQAEKLEIIYKKNTATITEIAKIQTQINILMQKQSNASGISVLGTLTTGYSGGILVINRLYQNKMLSKKSVMIAGVLVVVGIFTTASGEINYALNQKDLIPLKEALNTKERELKMQNELLAQEFENTIP